MNDFTNVGTIIGGKLPDDFDVDVAMDEFLEEYYDGDPKHQIFLEDPTYGLYKEEPSLTIDSGYSYLPGAWFMEWVAETYEVCIEVEAFSITDDELLDKFVVGVEYAD